MTRLYYTDAGNGVGRFPIFKFMLLDLDGKIQESFEGKEYTIVGLSDVRIRKVLKEELLYLTEDGMVGK